ncbi:MAG: phosphatidylinositol kinase [Bacteroidetes bacterium]|nr:phosphatidylinositol kinase [Bacteroidota bacterium]
MRKTTVFYKGAEAGTLTANDDGSFLFSYSDLWMAGSDKPPISLTLPKSVQEHRADHLFPFFYNMLPEGSNRETLRRLMRIDADDLFGLLLAAAGDDAIGAVTVRKAEDSI